MKLLRFEFKSDNTIKSRSYKIYFQKDIAPL